MEAGGWLAAVVWAAGGLEQPGRAARQGKAAACSGTAKLGRGGSAEEQDGLLIAGARGWGRGKVLLAALRDGDRQGSLTERKKLESVLAARVLKAEMGHELFKEGSKGSSRSFKSIKTAVFPYPEVCDATSNFSESKKIGQGSYGCVYRED